MRNRDTIMNEARSGLVVEALTGKDLSMARLLVNMRLMLEVLLDIRDTIAQSN